MNRKLKSVRQIFNQYGTDQELDFLTLVHDRRNGRMIADYNINGYSDDLAEGFTQAMENSPSFAQFFATAIGRMNPEAYNWMVTAIENARDAYEETLPTVEEHAEETAHQLIRGEVTMEEVEADLREAETGDYVTHSQLEQFRHLVRYYYNQLLDDLNGRGAEHHG